jgi:gliding motility-associated-like protein
MFDFQAQGNYTNSATFDWDFGPWATIPATTNLTDENPQGISFNSTGTQLIKFTVTQDGCVGNTYQSTVLIHKMPVANFTADTLIGCSPMIVNFTNLSESDDPFKTTEWTILNETIISNNFPTIVFNDPGQYDISLKVTTEYGCEDIYTINNFISVSSSPRADFSLSPEVVQIIQPEMDFIDLSDDADEVYYIVNNVDTVYQAETTYTFPDTGIYSIRQVVTTQFGCVDSLTKQALVELGYKVFIPSSFTPNDDGYNDIFRVYGEDVLSFEMIIYNRWGQKLYQSYDMENGWDGKSGVRTSSIDGGMYFYRVEVMQRNGLKNTFEGNVVVLK